MLLHYLDKLKNQKCPILTHVKHISNVTFLSSSNRCLPNVMKINAKINTMQNTNTLLFVRSLSLTYWRNASLRYGPISNLEAYWQCSLPVKKASPGMCPCKRWTFWTPFCEHTVENNLHFHVFWFKRLLSIVSAFYCVDAWWSIGLPWLTAKL